MILQSLEEHLAGRNWHSLLKTVQPRQAINGVCYTQVLINLNKALKQKRLGTEMLFSDNIHPQGENHLRKHWQHDILVRPLYCLDIAL